MAFYAGRLVVSQKWENPTLVILTDRNDLDDQLFRHIARCHECSRQKPVQAQDRQPPEETSRRRVGRRGVYHHPEVFSRRQGRQHPLLSDRRNIVVIADEATAANTILFTALPGTCATRCERSFIGFTGTPIEKADANTRLFSGDYISIYDIQRAVER